MQAVEYRAGLLIFDDLELFKRAVDETGFIFDFQSLSKLNVNFLKSSDQNLILLLKDYEGDFNNILFLSEREAFLYTKSPPPVDAFKTYDRVYGKPYGKSTVLAFLTLNKVLLSYRTKLEALINCMRGLEEDFDAKRYRDLTLEFERLIDKVEDFHDILLRLEERQIREVETRYLSFDYSILIAESNGLLDRCRHRLSMLREIAWDYEMQTTRELNRRIERLNDVVKRLTALTLILMIPTLIASHFGMNFEYMPELRIPWAYPAVIVVQALIAVMAIFILRRIGWL
ncbi:MAG: CorA family divalent cation transporter [Candidatus Bathyarchaeia archaeon]